MGFIRWKFRLETRVPLELRRVLSCRVLPSSFPVLFRESYLELLSDRNGSIEFQWNPAAVKRTSWKITAQQYLAEVALQLAERPEWMFCFFFWTHSQSFTFTGRESRRVAGKSDAWPAFTWRMIKAVCCFSISQRLGVSNLLTICVAIEISSPSIWIALFAHHDTLTGLRALLTGRSRLIRMSDCVTTNSMAYSQFGYRRACIVVACF